jgi:hypothetical protein
MKFGLSLCGRQTQRQIIPSYTPHLCTAFEPLRERCGRHGQHYEREQQRTNGWDDTHCASFCLIILGLPGDALLLRVTWMRGTISGRNAMHTFISLANSSAMTFSFRSSYV